MIITAEHKFKSLEDHLRRIVNPSRKQIQGLPGIPSVVVREGVTTRARVNHSRWIADCPWCNGAELVFVGRPLFLCQSCWNDGTGQYIRVIVPKNQASIDEELNKRRKVENRNWDGETMKALKAETAAHEVK